MFLVYIDGFYVLEPLMAPTPGTNNNNNKGTTPSWPIPSWHQPTPQHGRTHPQAPTTRGAPSFLWYQQQQQQQQQQGALPPLKDITPMAAIQF